MCVGLCSSGKWGFLPWFYLFPSLISVPWHAQEDWGVVVVDLCSLWWDVSCVQQIPLALHTPQLTGVLQFLWALSSLSLGFAPQNQNHYGFV